VGNKAQVEYYLTLKCNNNKATTRRGDNQRESKAKLDVEE